jgi:hypothetical protein
MAEASRSGSGAERCAHHERASAPIATASAAHLKFLHHEWQIPFRNFKWKSGTRINKFASAHDFPKFVKGGAEVWHELRKVGTSAAHLRFLHHARQHAACEARRTISRIG